MLLQVTVLVYRKMKDTRISWFSDNAILQFLPKASPSFSSMPGDTIIPRGIGLKSIEYYVDKYAELFHSRIINILLWKL